MKRLSASNALLLLQASAATAQAPSVGDVIEL